MAGFLNKKNRLIDFKLTDFGRSKLSIGKLSFKYYTFSDSSIFYKEDFNNEKTFKVSSDGHYLPFEVDSLNEKIINQELKLDKIAKREIQETVLLNNSLTTKFSLSDYLIEEKYITNSEYIKDNYQIKFSFKDEKDSFDFNNSTFTYPTIKQVSEKIENIETIQFDKRFSHMLKNMTLLPEEIDIESIENEKLEIDRDFDFSYIFKNLNFTNNMLSLDTDISFLDRKDTVLSAIRVIENNKEIHRLDYKIYENTTKKSDQYLFELFESKGQELNKLTFIDLGDFFDSKKMKYIQVYLIGKVFMKKQEAVAFNEENNRKYLSINRDYVFLNMFTLVVE